MKLQFYCFLFAIAFTFEPHLPVKIISSFIDYKILLKLFRILLYHLLLFLSGLCSMQAPKVSFKKPIGSVSVSGHKFVGCPMPCGVEITKGYKGFQKEVQKCHINVRNLKGCLRKAGIGVMLNQLSITVV